MELRASRIVIEKTSKAARDDAVQFSKAVIAAENELVSITEPLEKALLAQRDQWDENERLRKEAEAAAERARLLAISEKIAALRNYLTLASQCRSSERIQSLFDKLAVEEITAEVYAEFEDEAAQAKAETLARIKPVLEAKQAEEAAREAEQRRLEAERLAAAEARRAAEEAQRAADEAAAKVAAERAELERQQRELAAQQAEFLRQQSIVAAEAQALADAAMNPPSETAQWPESDGKLHPEHDAPQAAPEPIPGIDDVPTPAPVAVATRATPSKARPTDGELIEVLSQHYRVHEMTVVAWLLDMDMQAVSELAATEFV